MTPEGMVHALDEIHRLLVPGGCLIDIHPAPEAYLIEVHKNGKVIYAEAEPDYSTESYIEADKALEEAVRRQLYSPGIHDQFDYYVYAPSTAELNDYLNLQGAFAHEPGDETISAREAELYRRVDKIIDKAGAGAEVATHEKVLISNLIPIK